MSGTESKQTDSLLWFATHVRSRHELKVLDSLTKSNIDAFLPTVEKLRKWKDRKKMVTFPLFPGYLFVRINNNHQDRLTVLKTKGIVRLLGMENGKPEPVPEEQINSLKKLVENKLDLDLYPYLTEGQRVRIKSGPLDGIEGILVEKIGQHMLVLSVDILQRGAALTISITDVEKV